MENNEKINREKKIILSWNELKSHKEKLHDILMGKIGTLDSVVIYQCIAIVAENISIHKEAMRKQTNVIRNGCDKNLSKEEILVENLTESIKFLSITFDSGCSLTERLDAVEKIRNTAWQTICKKEDELNNILAEYSGKVIEINNLGNDVGYILTCISIVLLELDMKEEEARLLDEIYG